MHIVDNAVIMAAGTASRFAPLSYEKPKALITVNGEVLIERQIRQLKEAGIPEIYLVVGYKAEMFSYLEEKFGVHLITNPDYLTRNNNASIYAVKDILKNTYICSADNYFSKNPFEKEVSECYYAAIYANGPTKEWCMEYDENGVITQVQVGGENAWFMLGHTFWDETFSKKFLEILEAEYDLPETANLLWESIYMKHLDELKMHIRKYSDDVIFEFDTLDELREFDRSYVTDTRSEILKFVAKELNCREEELLEVTAYKDDTNEAAGFTFHCRAEQYRYSYVEKNLRRIG
jgi:CTP:phosphocholine cytidylyltransferase-like protein